MREYQRKRQIKHQIYSPITFLVLLVITLLFVHAAWSVYWKKRQSQDELNYARQTLEDYQAKEKILARDIDRLHTTAGVEAEIRDKFNVAKLGENTIIIINDSKDDPAVPVKRSYFSEFLHKMKSWFGGS